MTTVTPWPLAEARRAGLAKVETELAVQPGSLELRFERACILCEMGRSEEARRAYLELLVREPTHCQALNNLGTLLYASGYRTAARTAYSEAVFHHPKDATSRVNLANLLLQEGELEEAREHFEAALKQCPDHPQAHQGMGSLLAEMGEPLAALEHQRIGYSSRAVIELPYRGETPPIRVLLLMSANGANVPIRHLLDDRTFETTVVLPQFYHPADKLPEHDIVFNAIGDADNSAVALESAITLAKFSRKRMINDPAAVLRTGRTENLGRFSRFPGVVTAQSALLPRAVLANASEAGETLQELGFVFPLLLRTPGFHNGRHFIKVYSLNELPEALCSLPGAELIVLQFLDARGADAKVRKYRVMFVNGKLYPLHLAISSLWKIHYVTSEMAESAVHRAEEARFLADMAAALGPKAMTALKLIESELGLDYAGIDFSLSPEGDVLLFEANATMVVLPPAEDARWDYRRAALDRVQEAVRDMLTTPPRRKAKLPM